MKNSAQPRRDPRSRRGFSFAPRCALGPARRRSGGLAHLLSMTHLAHPVTGLEPVLTTSELAAHLGVPVQTIHDLRHAGRGPRGIRIGRELRFRVSEIEAWLSALEEHTDTSGDVPSAGVEGTGGGR